MSKVLLSTVIPVFRGERHLARLVGELAAVRSELEDADEPVVLAEAIFVDDESADGSTEVLEDARAKYRWIRVIHMSKNFGQHPATMAGILHSSGDWVATLDEDLQHRPRHLIAMLCQAVESTLDVVYAQPSGSVHAGRFRDWSSRAYKRLMSWIASNPEISKFNSFRLMRGSVSRAAAAVSGHDTYLDVALCWFTKRIGVFPVEVRDIRSESGGRSGYGLRRLLAHARRMLVSSQIRVLRAAGALGLGVVGISMLLSAAVLVIKLLYPGAIALRGWTSLILAIAFFGGLSALLTGIALEYLSSLLLKAHGRPAFFVVDRSSDELLSNFVRRHRADAAAPTES